MKWFRRKKTDRWKVSLVGIGTTPLLFENETEWEFDLNHPASITVNASIIDCSHNGTCETATPGGFRVEVIPVD
jgi:hypothetical protein